MSSSSQSSATEDSLSETSTRMSEESVQSEQSEGPKPRGRVTPQLVTSFVHMVNASENTNLRQIALTLGVSLSTVYRVLQKIRSGELVRDNKVVFPVKAKGRKKKYNSRTVDAVKDVLTSDPTMTLEMARAALQRSGINIIHARN